MTSLSYFYWELGVLANCYWFCSTASAVSESCFVRHRETTKCTPWLDSGASITPANLDTATMLMSNTAVLFLIPTILAFPLDSDLGSNGLVSDLGISSINDVNIENIGTILDLTEISLQPWEALIISSEAWTEEEEEVYKQKRLAK